VDTGSKKVAAKKKAPAKKAPAKKKDVDVIEVIEVVEEEQWVIDAIEELVVESDAEVVLEEAVVEAEEAVVEDVEPIIATPTHVDAYVKGTWVMTWANVKYDFADGKQYSLPQTLYNFLRSRGNIYDTKPRR
jgi:hypothetical protein